MPLFRLLLVVLVVGVLSYTLAVARVYGLNPTPALIGDIVAMIWSGQMHINLVSTLLLAAVWIVWRHQYSLAGFAAAIATLIGGVLFLAPYLLALSVTARGNALSIVLGEKRAALQPVSDPTS